MGIFSRLFGGGDGEPPDESGGDGATETAAREQSVAPIAAAIEAEPPSAPAPKKYAPAGSEPTSLPKVEPNMWVWPGSIPVGNRLEKPEPVEKPLEAKPPEAKPGRSTGRIPKQPATIVDSGPTESKVVFKQPSDGGPNAPDAKPKQPALIVDSGPNSVDAKFGGEPRAAIEAKTPPRDPTLVASPPPASAPAIEAKTALRDPTLVMSPPPPAATAATGSTPPLGAALANATAASKPPAKAPPAAPPRAKAPTLPPPKRGKTDTINNAFESLIARDRAATQSDGVSTAADLAEVRLTFEQVAAVHVTQVRDVMLELRFGGADPAWLEAAKPAVQSVRKMAAHMELPDLVKALDAFCTALEAAVKGGLDDKTALLRTYDKLIELVPRAFELSAEHDRREPIIVESLLLQVDGVERPTIDQLSAVGLGRLEALLAANANDLAAVTGLRKELAEAIVARVAAYRAAGSTLAAVDVHGERKQLHDLAIMLSLHNDNFRRVANSWKPDDVAQKRELRKQRERTYHQVRVVLARLGERDQLQRLDKLTFDDRIAMLDKLITMQLAG